MATTSYDVLAALRCDGKDYAEGDTVDLEPKAAKPLIAAGVIAAPAKTEKKADSQ